MTTKNGDKVSLIDKIFSRTPVVLTIIAMLIGLIIYVVNLNARIDYLERDHVTFGDFFQRQIDEIKAGILRIEDKLDQIK